MMEKTVVLVVAVVKITLEAHRHNRTPVVELDTATMVEMVEQAVVAVVVDQTLLGKLGLDQLLVMVGQENYSQPLQIMGHLDTSRVVVEVQTH
jgi:hypothetical protein